MQAGPSITLHHKARLGLTPALWQAIGLLQMSAPEMAAFVEAQCRDNPFLRIERPPDHGSPPRGSIHRHGDAKTDFTPAQAARPVSLFEHVAHQMNQETWSGPDRAIARAFLEALEPSGWLGVPLAELAERAACSVRQAQRILSRLQGYEPAGLFARTLSECLRLQLADRDLLTADTVAVLSALDLVAAGDMGAVARRCDLSPAQVERVLATLRTLDPKPGAAFAHQDPTDITPDVVVSRNSNGWQVELNRSILPGVMIDGDLLGQVADSSGAVQAEFRRAYGTARWIVEAVRRRNETLLAVATELVRRQIPFVERGPASLAPLGKKEIARDLGLSESTVSRVTRSGWAQLPRGTVAFQSFFAGPVRLANGAGYASVPMVQALIETRLASENPRRPYSDQDIVHWLDGQGITLARRTVAKYRGALGMPGRAGRRKAAPARN